MIEEITLMDKVKKTLENHLQKGLAKAVALTLVANSAYALR